MKSVVIQAPNQFALARRELPQPAAGEVRVKVRYASICGSDVHIWRGHNPFARYPRVIGHEFFGVIESVGPEVDAARIGEKVAVDPVVNCGRCYPCSIGRPNVCTHLQVIGVHRDGGFSEYVCAPAANAYPIPPTIPDNLASLVEPFTIAANITAFLQPAAQDIALIYGAGPMGLTVAQVLKGVYGVGQIIVVDHIDERLTMAQKNGADITLNNQRQDLAQWLTGQRLAPTLIVDAACHPSILQQAIELASPAARIGLMGFSAAPCAVIQQQITAKELAIYSSRLNALKFPQVIKWMTDGLISPARLVTHYMHIDEAQQALTLFETGQRTCCKVILKVE